jgi:dihydrodipicolinate synthase/N-acetylneuraminate lyase
MIQQLNSVDQYCCLFHIVHQRTSVSLSKEAMHRVGYVRAPALLLPRRASAADAAGRQLCLWRR